MKHSLILCLGVIIGCVGCSKPPEQAANQGMPREDFKETASNVDNSDNGDPSYPEASPVNPAAMKIPPTTPQYRVEPPVAEYRRVEQASAEPYIDPGPPLAMESPSTTGEQSFTEGGAAEMREPVGEDEDDRFAVVEVFFGTDRATDADATPIRWLALGVSAALAVVFLVLAIRARPMLRLGPVLLLVVAGVCLALTASFGAQALPLAGMGKVHQGEGFGNQRGSMVLGKCEVTIPKDHVSGELESPSLLRLEFREDQTKHVVLADIEQLDAEAFYGQLRNTVADAQRRELLVFVHGYNVTFENAARRTAQIAYDLEFPGAPVCFSWPSQGGLFKYTVDETNVEWCVPDLKQFLLDLREKSGADAINLIAHSMGNRAMTSALRDIALESRDGGVLFNEVVLAAPDIDAEVFRRRIAPVITKTANHVTLYASANDQALLASKKVHGYARAGNSADGVVVMPGIETIDASGIDTSLLGHSYVGDCERVIKDIHQIVHQSLRASDRRMLQPVLGDQTTWWTFQELGRPIVEEPTVIFPDTPFAP